MPDLADISTPDADREHVLREDVPRTEPFSTPALLTPWLDGLPIVEFPTFDIDQASSNADVAAALSTIDEGQPLDVAAEQSLLLSLWRQTERLEVARRAIRAFVSNLAWSIGENNIEIAQRIRRSTLVFPELDLEFDRSDLLIELGRYTRGGNNLVGLLIGVLIDPDNVEAVDRLILGLRQAGHWTSIARLLPSRLKHGCPSTFVTTLLPGDAAGATGCEVEALVEMLDRVEPRRGLATLSLGAEIDRRAGLPRSGAIDPLTFASTLLSARRHTRKQRTGGTPRAAAGLGERAAKLAALLPQTSASPRGSTTPTSSAPSIRWWVDFLLDTGEATVPASQFRTNYAERVSSETLGSTRHPVDGSRFQYGPYVTLSRGTYSVTFLGSTEPNVKLEMLVSSAYGTKILATGLVLSNSRELGIIGELGFAIDEESASCEFLLTSHSRTGRVESQGVKLRRMS